MRVLHIVRKRSQLNASFIINQINFHLQFEPVVINGFSTKLSDDFGLFQNNAVEINSLNFENYFALKYYMLFELKKGIKKRFNVLINRIMPDVIHLHYGSDAAIFLPYLKKFKIPTIVSFYGYDCSGFPHYFFNLGKFLLKKKVFNNASFVTAMSEDMKHDLLKIGCERKKILVHYHGINTIPFVFDRLYENKSKIKLLIISGFTPQKGHFFLLNAFKKALSTNKNLYLTIVGGGPLEHKIQNYINDNNIINVEVKPSVTYSSNEHINYLKDADIFIHPSITDNKLNKEGIPGSIVEAMCSGLPVISTYHAGIPSIIINNHSGILVDEHDIDALSNAIIELSDNVSLRNKIGANAKKFAIENLSVELKEKELEDIYLMAIKQNQIS